MSDKVELGIGHARRETEKALLVYIDDLGEERWIPKSQLHDDSEVYGLQADQHSGEVVVKAWWAEKEGLV